jgi:mono/diheme cytochrome c family protein
MSLASVLSRITSNSRGATPISAFISVNLRPISALMIAAACALTACRQDMHDQPKYKPLAASSFFPDGRSARPIPAGTIARGELNNTGTAFTGVDNGGRFVDQLPVPLTRQLVYRGRERFDIYCSPCHGLNADGIGMVALRGFRAPPSLLTDRVQRMPVGYIFAVISNGFGGMPDYSEQVAAPDRWAIITYIRALQIGHNATAAEVPSDKRGELEAASGESNIAPKK